MLMSDNLQTLLYNMRSDRENGQNNFSRDGWFLTGHSALGDLGLVEKLTYLASIVKLLRQLL